jgi:hypothetical protein
MNSDHETTEAANLVVVPQINQQLSPRKSFPIMVQPRELLKAWQHSAPLISDFSSHGLVPLAVRA